MTALLAALMEPAPAYEAEFNDWYDTEHIPERRPITGFLSLQRFVCTEGAPRYLALYDLTEPGVLSGPGYAAVSGPHTSPWSLRLAPHLRQRQRFEAVQLAPGDALLDARGKAERLALWHWRGLGEEAVRGLHEALVRAYREVPNVAQIRVFRADAAEGPRDHLALVEFTGAGARADVGAVAIERLVRLNHYRRYTRSAA